MNISAPPVQVSSATPENVTETGSAGTSILASRADHVHALTNNAVLLLKTAFTIFRQNGSTAIVGNGTQQNIFSTTFISADLAQGDSLIILLRWTSTHTLGVGSHQLRLRIATTVIYASESINATNSATAIAFAHENRTDGAAGLIYSFDTRDSLTVVRLSVSSGLDTNSFGASFSFNFTDNAPTETNVTDSYDISVLRIPR